MRNPIAVLYIAIVLLLVCAVGLQGCIKPIQVKPIPPIEECKTENEALVMVGQMYNKLVKDHNNLGASANALLEHYYDHMEKEHPIPEKRDI